MGLIVSLKKETRANKPLHGLYRTLINNMIIGVSEQFVITLILQGVGYRASVQGKTIILNLGFSHPVNIDIPDGINVEVIQNTTINIKACDKEQLGLFAAKIRSWRPPEPYKYKKLKRESVRGLIKGTVERPRLSVFRSNEHIYAQIIDDTTSKTLVSCSTLDRDIKLNSKNGRTCDASRLMGEKLAELSKKKNITKIVFDRGPYLYHGRIKAL